ncbi:MAG: TnpV protein [Clostridiales bacterium]|nr:TnpV protein [Clostridiales bacterium]
MSEITYTQTGDYLIPDITIQETEPLGKYGMMRKHYLQEHREILYTTFALQGKLFPHCLEIEKTANERLERMMAELAERNPPTDKAADPLGWAAHMNSLKAQAEEAILAELIYN